MCRSNPTRVPQAIALGLGFTALLLAGPVTAAVTFTEVAQSAGVHLVHDSLGFVTSSGTSTQDLYGPGVAIEDFNNDGWLDLFLTNGQAGNHLYLNNADGTFTDVTASVGIGPSRVANGIAVADVDNNGYRDFVLGNFYAEPQLYLQGAAGFGERSEAYGIVPLLPGADPVLGPTPESMGCAFGDFDQNGFVDLYVANYRDQQDVLYRNAGGSLLTYVDGAEVTAQGYGFQAVFLDFDDDGDRDLYVANDFGYNFMLRNEGAASGWTFTEVAVQDGVAGGENSGQPKSMSMGLAVGDYDNDLDQDILVTNFRLNALYRNDGPGLRPGIWKWTEVAAQAGLEYPVNCWGIEFVDLDNDTDLDVVQASGFIQQEAVQEQPLANPNQVWLNDGPGAGYTFTNISAAAGFDDTMLGRGLATGDIDRDGDVDIAVVNNTFYDPTPDDVEFTLYEGHSLLYRNDQDEGRHWVNLRLEGSKGRGGKTNRDAIGARIWLTAGGLTQMREVQSGQGYLSHSSLEVEFGLGDATLIEDVTVRWTDGTLESFTGVTADGFHRLVEGSGVAVPVPVALSSFDVRALDTGVLLQWRSAPGVRVVAAEIRRARAGADEELRRVDVDLQLGTDGGTAFDSTVQEGIDYLYQLVLVSESGQRVTSAVAQVRARGAAPSLRRAEVGQNFPNPFNPRTSIQFRLPRTMHAELVLFDAQGRQIRVLFRGEASAGEHVVEWDGRDDAGREVASGVYAYALRTEDGTSSRRMVLTR